MGLNKGQNLITAVLSEYIEKILPMTAKNQRAFLLVASYIKWGASNDIVEYVDIPVIDIVNIMGWHTSERKMSTLVQERYNKLFQEYISKEDQPFDIGWYDEKRKIIRFLINKPEAFCKLPTSGKQFVKFYTEDVLSLTSSHSLQLLFFLTKCRVSECDNGRGFDIFTLKKAFRLELESYCHLIKRGEGSNLYQEYGEVFLSDWKNAEVSQKEELQKRKAKMLTDYNIDTIEHLDWIFFHMHKFDRNKFMECVLGKAVDDINKSNHTHIDLATSRIDGFRIDEYIFKVMIQ